MYITLLLSVPTGIFKINILAIGTLLHNTKPVR